MGVCATCKTISLPCNNNGECVDSQQSNSNLHSIQKNISTSTTANNKEMTNISNKQTVNPYSKFDILMINEINSVRLTPKNYSLKIKNLIPLIKANKNSKIYLIYDDDVKIELKKGVTAFKNCIEFLNNRNNIALEPIEIVDELAIPFPSDIKLSLDKDYISRCIDDIRKSTKNRYDIFDFQYDISPNPVLSTIVQVVDDTNANFQRRNNILSENVRYVGISYGEIKKGIFCFYLLFAS